MRFDDTSPRFFWHQNMSSQSYVLTIMGLGLTLGKALRAQAVMVGALPKFDEAAICSTKKGV